MKLEKLAHFQSELTFVVKQSPDSLYGGSWYSGGTKSQGISHFDIEQVCLEYSSSLRTRSSLSYTINTMVADDLATSRQGISSHGIDPFPPEYSGPRITRVTNQNYFILILMHFYRCIMIYAKLELMGIIY